MNAVQGAAKGAVSQLKEVQIDECRDADFRVRWEFGGGVEGEPNGARTTARELQSQVERRGGDVAN